MGLAYSGKREPFNMSQHFGNTSDHDKDPHGVSPTFGSIGSYGATGLEIPPDINRERLH